MYINYQLLSHILNYKYLDTLKIKQKREVDSFCMYYIAVSLLRFARGSIYQLQEISRSAPPLGMLLVQEHVVSQVTSPAVV